MAAGLAAQERGGVAAGLAAQERDGVAAGLAAQERGGVAAGLAAQERGGVAAGLAAQERGELAVGLAAQEWGGVAAGLAAQERDGVATGLAAQDRWWTGPGQIRRKGSGQVRVKDPGQNKRGVSGQNKRGGKNRRMKNGASVNGERLPLTGPGIRPPAPTSGAIIPRPECKTGARERGLGKGGDRRLGTGRVQRNVSKSDKGGAWRDRQLDLSIYSSRLDPFSIEHLPPRLLRVKALNLSASQLIIFKPTDHREHCTLNDTFGFSLQWPNCTLSRVWRPGSPWSYCLL